MCCIFFGLRNLRRLADVLSGRVGLEGVWQEPWLEAMMFPVVLVPPDSVQLLRPKRFLEFFGRVRQRFDYVLLCTSSSGLVSDTVILAIQGDRVLLVVGAQNTFRCSSRRIMRNPEGVRLKVIGTTIANVRHSRLEYC